LIRLHRRGLSYDEIAAHFGKPEGTVAVMLCRLVEKGLLRMGFILGRSVGESSAVGNFGAAGSGIGLHPMQRRSIAHDALLAADVAKQLPLQQFLQQKRLRLGMNCCKILQKVKEN
jgi:hypothetical protein